MDHQQIVERGLIEAYHLGRIPPEEEEAFEAHFFACPECAAQLELARGFERGLKAMVAEDLARQAVRAGLWAWLARRSALARWGVPLAVLLLAAGLPLLWLARERGALRQAREESAALRSRAGALEERLAAEERQPRDARRVLEERLAAGGQGVGEKPLAPLTEGPLVNTPVFLLSLIRGGEAGGGVAIDPSRTGSHFALALDVDDTPGVASYRVTVTNAQGRECFRQAGVKRNSLETLLLTFPSGFFPAGDYRLKVEALPAKGPATEVGEYRFRVIKP